MICAPSECCYHCGIVILDDICPLCGELKPDPFPLFKKCKGCAEKDAEIAKLREALEFYAKGKHIIHHKPTCFVDGEPVGNGWYSYENGQVAKKALETKP
jgi:hypothetical protein